MCGPGGRLGDATPPLPWGGSSSMALAAPPLQMWSFSLLTVLGLNSYYSPLSAFPEVS